MFTGFSTPLTWVAVNWTGAGCRVWVTCRATMAAPGKEASRDGPDQTPACTAQQPQLRLCSLALYRLFICREGVLHGYMHTRSAHLRSWLKDAMEGRVTGGLAAELPPGDWDKPGLEGDTLKTRPLHSCEVHTRGC